MTTTEALKMAEDALETMLASAYPHPTEHPTMTEAWKVGGAALAVIRTAPDWRPIETAPRDGTRILLALPNSVRLGRWCNNYDKWMDGYDLVELMPPKAWMPLPAPPATPGGGR